MPTMNPRITFTVSEELMGKIDEYRFQHRLRNQTQAIVSLINMGLESVTGRNAQPTPKFSEEEVQLLELYNHTEPMYRDVAVKIMRDNQRQEKSHA